MLNKRLITKVNFKFSDEFHGKQYYLHTFHAVFTRPKQNFFFLKNMTWFFAYFILSLLAQHTILIDYLHLVYSNLAHYFDR